MNNDVQKTQNSVIETATLEPMKKIIDKCKADGTYVITKQDVQQFKSFIKVYVESKLNVQTQDF